MIRDGAHEFKDDVCPSSPSADRHATCDGSVDVETREKLRDSHNMSSNVSSDSEQMSDRGKTDQDGHVLPSSCVPDDSHKSTLTNRTKGKVFVSASASPQPSPSPKSKNISLSLLTAEHNYDVSPFTFPSPQDVLNNPIFSPCSPPPPTPYTCGGLISSCHHCVDAAAHLCGIDNAPWWCKSKHIVSGYRVNYNTQQTLMSIFSLHNETCNIWTHLLGLFLFISLAFYRHQDLLFFPPTVRYCFYAFYVCVSLCMACSALYHTTLSISETWHTIAYSLDLTGIVFCIMAQYILGIAMGFACNPEEQTPYLVLCLGMCAIALIAQHAPCSRHPNHMMKRVLPLLLFASSAVLPYLHFLTFAKDHQIEHLSMPAVGSFIVYGIGVVIWLSGVPERFIPQKLDRFITSHGLWHICVVAAAALFESGMFRCARMLANGLWCD